MNLNVLKFAGLLFLAFGAKSVEAQTTFSQIKDEFTDSATLNSWKQFHKEENFPSMINSLSIKDGQLWLEPGTSGWYADFHAPFMFKEISGNFYVETRVKVTGKENELPQSMWSLGGLMIREPKTTKMENWVPNQENWLFITTGIAQPLNVPAFEVKTTTNSGSNLKLRPARSGWVSLRVVRLEGTFLLMYRYEDTDKWEILERFYRPRTPQTLQVGLNAYTDFYSAGALMRDPQKFNTTIVTNGKPDLLMKVEYFRVKEVKLSNAFKEKAKTILNAPFSNPENLLSDYAYTNEDILKAIGN